MASSVRSIIAAARVVLEADCYREAHLLFPQAVTLLASAVVAPRALFSRTLVVRPPSTTTLLVLVPLRVRVGHPDRRYRPVPEMREVLVQRVQFLGRQLLMAAGAGAEDIPPAPFKLVERVERPSVALAVPPHQAPELELLAPMDLHRAVEVEGVAQETASKWVGATAVEGELL